MIFYSVCNVASFLMDDDVISHQKIKYFLVSESVYSVLNLYRNCVVCVFQMWILSLKLRFQLLHEWVCNNRMKITEAEISKIRCLHLQLCEICTSVNKVYSIPIVIGMSMNFFVFVFQIYEFVILPSKNSTNLKHILNTTIYLSWAVFEFLATVIPCALLTKHEQKLRLRLYEVFNSRASLRPEINSLSVQMLHFNTEMTAAGFFVIDASLLFQFAGAGATYLFIFLQFYYLNN
ncbi:hypothetical protein FQR65_LT11340 [Abscondita terminalis]|nr:hypothetical protein FQR65_LT11340 [Abscondita terminalis]